ncbi:KTI12-like protein [Artemisia annua]|uniref:KTI12-like protein n=1 Tax=Artemisia annua TaxID=35608 RepID=A0A2U1P928_ARTAN|nr:KTI12-like protein [Artemisia annua]
MTSEKNLRGVLRSEVDRSLSKDSIIIVDSLNSIKGYRYELWCLARAAGIRHCVLFCDVEETQCRDWNKERREKDEPSYDDRIFEDLVRRFERPDSRNRWDSPLFELFPFKEGIDKSSPAIVDLVSYVTKKVDTKTRDVKILQPTIATQSARFSEANSLYEMDRATQEVTSAIVEAQSLAMGGPVTGLSLGLGLPTINISRSVGLPELRRLRKTFIKLTSQSSLSGPPPPTDADSAKRMFIDYLNREFGSG